MERPVTNNASNNNSSIQGTLLHDGAIAIAFNNSSAGTARDKPRTAARKPLTVALSQDAGKTWRWIRSLETGASEDTGQQNKKSDEYSYPSVLQDARGQIYVAYTYRHPGPDGDIEIRKNVDLAGRPGANHLFIADGKGVRYVDCGKVALPYGLQLVDDVLHRTEMAMTQAHCFLATELALRAQEKAHVVA